MKTAGGKVGKWESGICFLLCSLSHLLTCVPQAIAQTTNPYLVRSVVLMLPSNYAGDGFEAVTFHPVVRDGVLRLWPRADTGGGSNTINGITNINGQTALVQTFAVGTSGSDFAISSAAATHTWNLPTASAANRGALSSADWITFNNKQSSITWQTQGVTLATAPTTINYTTGVTGHVSGATAFLGVNVTGSSTLAVGGSAAVQFAEGTAFAGTNGSSTRFIYDRTNNALRITGLTPTIFLEDSAFLGTNEIGATYTRTLNSSYAIYTPFASLSVAGTIAVTNIIGLNHKAVASVLELNANGAHKFSVTNRVTGDTTLVFTNTSDGQVVEATVLGEIAGGTSRTITMVPQLGHLVADLDTFGTALATSSSLTLTQGNALKVRWEVARINGTNVAMKTSRQFAF